MKINFPGRPPEDVGVCVALNQDVHVLVDKFNDETGEWNGLEVCSIEGISTTATRPFEKFHGFGDEIYYDVVFPEHKKSFTFCAEDFEAQFLVVGAM